jgi:hypothetical protein
MTWSTPAELRAQVQKLWDKGALLAQLAGAGDVFPRRLALRGPTSNEMAERFDAVRIWIGALRQGAHYRVVMRELRHRTLGANLVPDEIWVDTLADALALIGKNADARRFCALLAQTRQRQGAALPWLAAHPLKALELGERWPLLLDVVAWFQAHPRPGIYLRQIDVAGVHSKFIEAHRAVLAELLDLALPADAIDAAASGASGFCRRYGLRDKPLRIRLRVLDPGLALLPGGAEQDITLDHASFARLAPPVERVFITENEINFLALPPVPGSLVLFGAGYGFDMLARAAWLQDCTILYWGDIDTHGFAILDQLRALFPHVESILMDRATLFAHEAQWGREPQPLLRDLARLSAAERALFDELRDNRIRPQLRLEQERIGFGWVEAALRNLPCHSAASHPYFFSGKMPDSNQEGKPS